MIVSIWSYRCLSVFKTFHREWSTDPSIDRSTNRSPSDILNIRPHRSIEQRSKCVAFKRLWFASRTYIHIYILFTFKHQTVFRSAMASSSSQPPPSKRQRVPPCLDYAALASCGFAPKKVMASLLKTLERQNALADGIDLPKEQRAIEERLGRGQRHLLKTMTP